MSDGAQMESWLSAFETALSRNDISAVLTMFHPDCYWRDLLAFTWNIKTMEGLPAIKDMLEATLARTKPHSWKITSSVEQQATSQSADITFESETGLCKSRITLVDGRCFTILSALDDIRGHEEPRKAARPKGLAHKADRNRRTWSEERTRESARLGFEEQPYVLVIGGGQGGIALGARLRQLGVPTLIIEKNARAGDSWRNRYRSLVLHDPVWYDHLPYLEFPENWPVFTPKDKLGDWLEAYAKIFELQMWHSTTCDKASYDTKTGAWEVHVTHDGEPFVLRPKQLVFATGAYGPPREMDFPGNETFDGTLMHSSAYQSGSDFSGKTCVVIGSASSAHDVCVDLWEAGADVTMLQRSPSVVVRSETLMELGFDIYSEDAVARGLDVEAADMLGASTPYALFADQQRELYKDIQTQDAGFYQRLAAAGFAFDFGEDGSGLMMKALRTASGYYIDVGASELIADGEIKVISGGDVVALTPEGLRLSSGQEVPAQVIIACTGYQSMNESVAGIVSRGAADAIGPCWGLGSGVSGDPGPWQGELRNMWKPTAVDALWFHGGNLALSRFYSRFVALQLKARMEGVATPVYAAPEPLQRGL
jgi:putative flavoprotein involved in K+ transport